MLRANQANQAASQAYHHGVHHVSVRVKTASKAHRFLYVFCYRLTNREQERPSDLHFSAV